jgi:hypothetical protein
LTDTVKIGYSSCAAANSARNQKKPKHRSIEMRPAK